jgi:hypothetical protein
MDTTHPTRRRALAALMSPAALVGAGADAPTPYPSEAEKKAVLDDIFTATRHIGGFEPVPDELTVLVVRHCLHLLKEVDRRDKAGLR